MVGDQIGLAVELKLVTVVELLSTHGADFTVDLDLALLNEGLCINIL